MPFTYGLTLFLSALLLFWVQPLIGKMALPLLGGAPAVWVTCMVFFQALLLLGYLYAHWLHVRFPVSRQLLIHGTILLAAALFLPVEISRAAAANLRPDTSPVPWLLTTLLVSSGLPFFVLSTTAPLLQSWFGATGHARSRDPYFLYALSNLGSFAALIGFPVLIERTLPIALQTRLWTLGFLATAALVLLSGWAALRLGAAASLSTAASLDESKISNPPTRMEQLWWIALSFVPSSLMLGVTSYLTTDIASIPLLWVIPLGLYLLTFVIVFARGRRIPERFWDKAMSIAAVTLMFLLLSGTTEPATLLLAVHLGFFFIAAMLCHGRLAAGRPAPEHLTRFYLCMSLGGALGGIFNGLIAPNLFSSIAEYPLAIVLACLMRWRPASEKIKDRARWMDLAIAIAIGLLTVAILVILPALENQIGRAGRVCLLFAPFLLAYFMSEKPLRFALVAAFLFIGGQLPTGVHGKPLHTERNFFGVLAVTETPDRKFRRLYHGTTLHGLQYTAREQQCEPLSYYHRDGPLGHIFEVMAEPAAPRRIAGVGLGAGASVCFSRARENWTFYEIDPAVVRIAQNSVYFTYLSQCARAPVFYVLGDARLRLESAPDREYDLIILDAFSSDAIPMHLLTREAFALYLRKLKPNGALAFHISSRHLDLRPLLANLAAEKRLLCWTSDSAFLKGGEIEGRYAADWVLCPQLPQKFQRLETEYGWSNLKSDPVVKVWTDDFSNLLSVLK